MRTLGVLFVLASATTVAAAAPAADLVVVWAPGMTATPVETAAKQAGAAVINQSPGPARATQTGALLQRGIEAFDKLELDQAWQLLEQARSEADRTGAAGLTEAQLSDLFLYRGLIKAQQDDSAAMWDELVLANSIGPTRELDPGRFPPKIRSDFQRARDTVQSKKRALLTVQAPQNCTVNVDGRPATGPIERIVGPHWISATCPDRRPYGYKIELTGDVTVPIEPVAILPPSDTDLLVQARTAGARAFVFAEVRSNVATARLVGLDGRERDRRTVSIESDLAPLADAVTDLLTPPPATHWYQSKWVWLAGGAAVAAAVLVPLTAFLSQDNGTASVDAKPMFPGGSPW